MKNCLIIGAGMAGLLAAQTLQAQGIAVTLLDKGHTVGGRMATRRIGRGRADHGAQFFTVRSVTFRQWVDQWLAAGVVQEWSRGFPPHNSADGHPRYRGVDGMTAVAQHLAHGLDIRLNCHVNQVAHHAGEWIATTVDGHTFTAEALIMTAPVPQSLALLDVGKVTLSPQARAELEVIVYNPCFAALVTLNGPSNLPTPGGVQVNGEPISWIGDNQMKGISAEPLVTIHASAVFTMAHFDDEPAAVAQLLIDAAYEQGWFDKALVREVQIKRWKFAQPTVLHPERSLLIEQPGPLAFAGDAFQEAKVEGAALSGLAVAEKLLQRAMGS